MSCVETGPWFSTSDTEMEAADTRADEQSEEERQSNAKQTSARGRTNARGEERTMTMAGGFADAQRERRSRLKAAQLKR